MDDNVSGCGQAFREECTAKGNYQKVPMQRSPPLGFAVWPSFKGIAMLNEVHHLLDLFRTGEPGG